MAKASDGRVEIWANRGSLYLYNMQLIQQILTERKSFAHFWDSIGKSENVYSFPSKDSLHRMAANKNVSRQTFLKFINGLELISRDLPLSLRDEQGMLLRRITEEKASVVCNSIITFENGDSFHLWKNILDLFPGHDFYLANRVIDNLIEVDLRLNKQLLAILSDSEEAQQGDLFAKAILTIVEKSLPFTDKYLLKIEPTYTELLDKSIAILGDCFDREDGESFLDVMCMIRLFMFHCIASALETDLEAPSCLRYICVFQTFKNSGEASFKEYVENEYLPFNLYVKWLCQQRGGVSKDDLAKQLPSTKKKVVDSKLPEKNVDYIHLERKLDKWCQWSGCNDKGDKYNYYDVLFLLGPNPSIGERLGFFYVCIMDNLCLPELMLPSEQVLSQLVGGLNKRHT